MSITDDTTDFVDDLTASPEGGPNGQHPNADDADPFAEPPVEADAPEVEAPADAEAEAPAEAPEKRNYERDYLVMEQVEVVPLTALTDAQASKLKGDAITAYVPKFTVAARGRNAALGLAYSDGAEDVRAVAVAAKGFRPATVTTEPIRAQRVRVSED